MSTHVVKISFVLVSASGDVLLAMCVLRAALTKHVGKSMLKLCVLVLQLMSLGQRLLHTPRHPSTFHTVA